MTTGEGHVFSDLEIRMEHNLRAKSPSYLRALRPPRHDHASILQMGRRRAYCMVRQPIRAFRQPFALSGDSSPPGGRFRRRYSGMFGALVYYLNAEAGRIVDATAATRFVHNLRLCISYCNCIIQLLPPLD